MEGSTDQLDDVVLLALVAPLRVTNQTFCMTIFANKNVNSICLGLGSVTVLGPMLQFLSISGSQQIVCRTRHTSVPARFRRTRFRNHTVKIFVIDVLLIETILAVNFMTEEEEATGLRQRILWKTIFSSMPCSNMDVQAFLVV